MDTAAQATQADGKRSRKGLIAGALAFLGAGALVEAKPARAGTDGDVVLGVENDTTHTTSIFITAGSADVLALNANDGIALLAQSTSLSEPSVLAYNTGVAPGVQGQSSGGAGLYGAGFGPSEGLYAQSGTGTLGTTPGKTRNGVHGVTNSATDSGVWGENVGGGYGVFGSTNTSGITGGAGAAGLNNGSGPGLRGASQNGAGVYGFAPASEGVYARSGSTDGTTPGATRSGVHGVSDSPGAGAVWGENVGGGDGVVGTSAGGAGVYATSSAAEGLYAQSGAKAGSNPGQSRSGVHAVTDSASDAAVYGENRGFIGGGAGGIGVHGSTDTQGIGGPPGVLGRNFGTAPAVAAFSESGTALYAIASDGLLIGPDGLYARSGRTEGSTPGFSASGVHAVTDGPSAAAVWGEHMAGGVGASGTTQSTGPAGAPGVSGVNHGSGPGVKGSSDSTGIGVYGTNQSTGTGVLAENTGTGPALSVHGSALFSRSGTVVIPSGATKATVTPPGGLTASSLVLALLQDVAGGVMVKAAVPKPGAGTFQIVLNKAPTAPATATVAWLVVN
jgi:hypothetical protein